MRLNQVTVAVADVGRAVDFYLRLGLKPVVLADRYARFQLPDGGSSFSVHAQEPPVRSDTVVYFECEDLDARCAALADAGVVFDSPPADQSWLWREARLRDPDGNPLCLFFAGENRLDPPWRVKDG